MSPASLPIPTVLLISLPGPWELVIILVIVFLLFGSRIPGVARSLGRSIVEFRRGLRSPDEPERKIEGGAGAEKLPGKKGSGDGD